MNLKRLEAEVKALNCDVYVTGEVLLLIAAVSDLVRLIHLVEEADNAEDAMLSHHYFKQVIGFKDALTHE